MACQKNKPELKYLVSLHCVSNAVFRRGVGGIYAPLSISLESHGLLKLQLVIYVSYHRHTHVAGYLEHLAFAHSKAEECW